ncbi:YARHG domain-containing protein [Paenibacillus sp. 19GGS1-52]|uniref:YARHG domain-containing protein n=1 Tax=Paenibacillus sp. 19GGS1-52 TaxID=2758563 RepID=UPI001EFB1F75|nr:YARHG domain-containing protein [Paenibacillus sp. 19GGS1-52]
MYFLKFRFMYGVIALSLIVSSCTYAKKEKANEGVVGKPVAASETTVALSTVGIREYILKDSSNTLLSPDQIGSLDNRILELARNEIFARHGYVFKRKDLQDYFAAKPWYHPDSAYKDHLSPTEKQNVALLRDYEAKYADYKLEPAHLDDVHLRDYTGDSGFKQKLMKVDLNGDGRKEEIQLSPPETEFGAFKLKVNNITMEVGSELLPYLDIVDLDIDDPYFEIALQMDSQMDFLRSTSFYAYDGETLKQIGALPDFSAHSSMFDGHGRVVSSQESKDFQTWFRDLVFRLDAKHSLHEEQQDFYPMEPPTSLTIIKEITVQIHKDGKDESFSLEPGDNVKFLGDDKLGHIKLQTSTGKEVWYTMGDEDVDYSNYFDGLILYD